MTVSPPQTPNTAGTGSSLETDFFYSCHPRYCPLPSASPFSIEPGFETSNGAATLFGTASNTRPTFQVHAGLMRGTIFAIKPLPTLSGGAFGGV